MDRGTAAAMEQKMDDQYKPLAIIYVFLDLITKTRAMIVVQWTFTVTNGNKISWPNIYHD